MRPIVGQDGNLLNPLAPAPGVRLSDDLALEYDDLRPDTTYVSPGFEYLTDEQGLPARVRGSLRLVPARERTRHPATQRSVGRLPQDSDPDYQGGHIVAVSLGGFASGPNLFPQIHDFNISAYARLEHGWRKVLREGGPVEVDIALTLDPDPYVPAVVVVTAWHDDEEWEHIFLNEEGAQ